MDNFSVEKVAVTTMQAISGGGYPGVSSMDIMDNVMPYISGEEEKMIIETKKLLGTEMGAAQMTITASCNRVPTLDDHLESAFVATTKKAEPNEVKDAMRQFKGLDLHSASKQPIIVRDEPDRPQTRPRRWRWDERGLGQSAEGRSLRSRLRGSRTQHGSRRSGRRRPCAVYRGILLARRGGSNSSARQRSVRLHSHL
jgi:aspartate-semialdehyde dehydrogenase